MGRPSPRVPSREEAAVSAAEQGTNQRSEPRHPPWRLLRSIGWAFHGGTLVAALGFAALIGAIIYLLVSGASLSWQRFGLGFLTGSTWDPVHGIYGAAPPIVGTLLTSALALLLGVPVALGVAIFLAEVAPTWLRRPLGYVVDLSAAVPSVVYGFWAYIVLVPLMRDSIEPWLYSASGGRFPFDGAVVGYDVLTASVILAIMIIPTIAALSREALLAVPAIHRESALSLGATRWEATRLGVLRSARGGILAGVMLGLGRALGETIAVSMVIGNIFLIPTSLLSPGSTLASWLIGTYPDSQPGLDRSASLELALILFAITFGINVVARWLIRRISERSADDRPTAKPRVRRLGHRRPRIAAEDASSIQPMFGQPLDPRAIATRRSVRRGVGILVFALAAGAVVLAIAPFADLIYTAVERAGYLIVQPSFYTSLPPIGCNPHPGVTCPAGGIGPEIQGTLIMLGLGSLIAVPGGVLIGIYLAEYGRNRFGRSISFLADVMTGVPTIILGVFVFTVFLLVDPDSALSALSGGVALGILMLPIATRATEEALRTVPSAVREAALALGFPRHRVTLRVVLGSSRGLIVTGVLLALSRAAGDTATLVLTAGGSGYFFQNLNTETAALTPFIFTNFGSNYLNLQNAAWGAALVLLLIMLAVGLVARVVVHARADALEGR